jgi:hypothetical protein
MKIYVLSYEYTDHSAYGIIHCYTEEQKALEVLDMMKEYGDSMKNFKLTCCNIPFTEEA